MRLLHVPKGFFSEICDKQQKFNKINSCFTVKSANHASQEYPSSTLYQYKHGKTCVEEVPKDLS